jgi:hypothetical protein
MNNKIEKEMPEFVSEVVGLSVEQLDARLAELAKAYEATSKAQEEDEQLQTARMTARELAAPYRDAKKAIRMKNSYIVGLIEEKGGK